MRWPAPRCWPERAARSLFGALGFLAAMFTFSSLVIGPALTSSDDEPSNPATPGVSRPLPPDHGTHHR